VEKLCQKRFDQHTLGIKTYPQSQVGLIYFGDKNSPSAFGSFDILWRKILGIKTHPQLLVGLIYFGDKILGIKSWG